LTILEKQSLYDLLAILGVSIVVVLCLLYAQVSGTYDATTLLMSVILPLVLGSAILSVRGKRILLFGYLAYFWAVVDDAPVFFDSVLTWPQVTRFHPFLPRILMNVVIHLATAGFMYLTMLEAIRGTRVRLRNATRIITLTSLSFVIAYAQNIPLVIIQNVVNSSWFAFDFVEKIVSVLLFSFAVMEALNLKTDLVRAGSEGGILTMSRNGTVGS